MDQNGNVHISDELISFINQVSQPHHRINPCFMTGKGCVYTEFIDREFEKRNITRENGSSEKLYHPSGFTIIPFKPNFNTFYDLCLQRYVRGAYREVVEITKADSVRKTGYVICEKICKKIQESDFVITDISVPNPNVFYELGLAYGCEQKIILICNKKNEFGQETAKYLSAQIFLYEELNYIKPEEFPLSKKIFSSSMQEIPFECNTLLLIDKFSFPGSSAGSVSVHTSEEKSIETGNDDIKIDFSTHVRAALGVAIDEIDRRIHAEPVLPGIYQSWIPKMKGDGIIETQERETFVKILESINKAFCVIIKTGAECHPMMYFWLGYCHARGKNVIPITEIEKTEQISVDGYQGEVIRDLAFDIRALWHMVFYSKDPSSLEKGLEETLYQMVVNDFSELSRKRFWDEILERRGKVSIFTGALTNKEIGREMIGDWDLRAVSELTSYFASHQYRASIESPVYSYDHVLNAKEKRKEYINSLRNMLKGKNCVIIASPDVNPLTEIVLGQVYGLEEDDWFNPYYEIRKKPKAVGVFKQLKQEDYVKKVNYLTFYRNEPQPLEEEKEKLKRGFNVRFLENLDDDKISGEFVSQKEPSQEPFHIHAHLLIVPNPFRLDDIQKKWKYIVILSGVSGPATFALTHVLTGGVSKEFVSYQNLDNNFGLSDQESAIFDPNLQSETFLQKILENIPDMKMEKQPKGLQCIIDVTVGSASDSETPSPFDWRHIINWQLVGKVDVFDVARETGAA